ncbi:tyrosine-type recombinase/integrase [Mangrovimonas aestuarii]|uniref:tyrosine-type recombinase/integrase n=1 Tax=Mangrovimonas aestuarii TaxID=3018443 RepID=UPI002378D2A6|nr:site-specific integrase [Mangrovimonas aestuarii]
MFTIEQILTFAYESEYETAYDLSLKKNFSNPKIYTANGDLSKRWYVYYSYRNPETGKLKRLTPFYGIANRYKTKEERLEVLTTYRKALLKLLKQGYTPFGDNTELYNRLNPKPEAETLTKRDNHTEGSDDTDEKPAMSIKDAFDFALKLKEKVTSRTTIRSYQNRVDVFINWLNDNYPNIKTVDLLSKKIVTEFLNEVLIKTSARSRNNYRTELSSVIQVLEDNDIIALNFIKKIPVLKSIPERNKTYSRETQKAIFDYLEKEDPILLLYIKFISYNFLRPIEVCRLRIKDVNLKDRTISFKAKNSPLKTKIIPDILWNDLPDLSNLNENDFLFTPEGIGGKWETDLNNKRDYFSKRFKKVVKDHFNLGKDYGLYSFRHTYITKLYRAMVKDSSPFEAKSKLMLITGHSTMGALEKYLRDIDAELPQDYSVMLKNTNE